VVKNICPNPDITSTQRAIAGIDCSKVTLADVIVRGREQHRETPLFIGFMRAQVGIIGGGALAMSSWSLFGILSSFRRRSSSTEVGLSLYCSPIRFSMSVAMKPNTDRAVDENRPAAHEVDVVDELLDSLPAFCTPSQIHRRLDSIDREAKGPLDQVGQRRRARLPVII
jgi:hypothetical protein